MRLEDIEKRYCLSLKRRPDRRRLVSKNLEEHDIEFEFFDAVDGQFMNIDRSGCNEWMSNASKGTFGIIESYIQLVKNAEFLGLSNFLIFEDDVEFCNTFQKDVNIFLENVPDDWDIIYFGGNHLDHFPVPVNEYVSRCVSTRTTHALIFRNTCYNKVLDKITSFYSPVDEMLAEMQKKGEVIAYVPVPSLVWQFESYSDIEEKKANYEFLKTYTEEDYKKSTGF